MSIRARFRREDLEKLFSGNPRIIRAFEAQAEQVDSNSDNLATTAQSTTELNQATVITLSSNTAFQNERVLALGDGLSGKDTGSQLEVKVADNIPKINGGFTVFFTVSGDARLFAPLSGTLATRENTETLLKKTLDAPKLSGLGNFVNDAAAATGGVPIGGIYRNGSVLQVRVA